MDGSVHIFFGYVNIRQSFIPGADKTKAPRVKSQFAYSNISSRGSSASPSFSPSGIFHFDATNAAAKPAPTPLSMFTTTTPPLQALSMESKAASPPKLAP